MCVRTRLALSLSLSLYEQMSNGTILYCCAKNDRVYLSRIHIIVQFKRINCVSVNHISTHTAYTHPVTTHRANFEKIIFTLLLLLPSSCEIIHHKSALILNAIFIRVHTQREHINECRKSDETIKWTLNIHWIKTYIHM